MLVGDVGGIQFNPFPQPLAMLSLAFAVNWRLTSM